MSLTYPAPFAPYLTSILVETMHSFCVLRSSTRRSSCKTSPVIEGKSKTYASPKRLMKKVLVPVQSEDVWEIFALELKSAFPCLNECSVWLVIMDKGMQSFRKTVKAAVVTYNMFILSRITLRTWQSHPPLNFAGATYLLLNKNAAQAEKSIPIAKIRSKQLAE